MEIVRVGLESLNKNKVIKEFLKGVLALLSVVVTHYAGFLYKIPSVMISVAAVEFFPTFSALFAFYLAFSYATARVFGFLLSQIAAISYISVGSIVFRYGKFLKIKRYLKLYKDRMKEENNLYWVFVVLLFCLFFSFAYVRAVTFEFSGFFIFCVVVIFVAAVLKTDILVISPMSIARRAVNKLRLKYRREMLASYMFVLVGIVLALSYYTGVLRFERLQGEKAVEFKSSGFNGSIKILISNADAVLAIEENDEVFSYVYASGKTVIRLPYSKKPATPADAESVNSGDQPAESD
jgi:hypothetical protein